MSWLTLMIFFVFSVMPPSGYAALTCNDLGDGKDLGFNCTDNGNGIDVTTLKDVNINLASFNTASDSHNVFNLSLGNFTANVTGIDPTLIGGSFEIKNGILSVFNPNGVHILSTADFHFENGSILAAAGSMNKITGKIDATGFVLNEGQFHGTGDVALVGKAVANKGTIDLPLNHVFIGAGKVVTVGLSGDNLVSVVVDEATDTKVKDFDGNELKDQIKDSGNIKAHKITLDAKGVDGVFEKAINLTGEIQATNVSVNDKGEVELTAIGGIYNSGKINAAKINEKGYTFKNTGMLQGGKLLMDNTDGAGYISGTVSMDVSDVGDIILDDTVTLGADVILTAGGVITFEDGVSLHGGGHSLTLKASGQSIIRSMDGLNDLILDKSGSSAEYTLRRAISMNGDLFVNAGATLDGTYSVTVSGGDVTGAGIINMTGGTFQVIGNGSFGGSSDWTFNRLEFGDGTTEGVTQKAGTNNITIAQDWKIDLKHTLKGGASRWNVTWGDGIMKDIVEVSAGAYHALALSGKDGSIYAWGLNESGQLGDGTLGAHYTPVKVLGITGAVHVSAGNDHSLALMGDGTVKAWGSNEHGQLGNGVELVDGASSEFSTIPVDVVGLDHVIEISGGGVTQIEDSDPSTDFSVALKDDGTVWTWGDNSYGQLGDGTTDNSSTPIQVVGVSGDGQLDQVTQIDAGGAHVLAVLENKTVVAWGNNDHGQLGNGITLDEDGLSTDFSSHPVEVLGLTDVREVAAGETHSLALIDADGSVWAWGDNNGSENNERKLGNNDTANSSTPVQTLISDGDLFVPLTGVKKIRAGTANSVALMNDGTVYVWGINSVDGELGIGSTDESLTPVQVSGVSGIKDITNGGWFTIALKDDGSMKSWGFNAHGELGNGNSDRILSPTDVFTVVNLGISKLTEIAQIVSGEYATFALSAIDGSIFSWGYNVGTLGEGTLGDHLSVVKVKGVGGTGYLTGIKEIAAGDNFTLALSEDGHTLYGFGKNDFGQLGLAPDSEHYTTPIVMDNGLDGEILDIQAGRRFALALMSDHTVKAWGSNAFGELGADTGENDYSEIALSVRGVGGEGVLENVTQISAGAKFALALVTNEDDSTSVFSWGSNQYGQLGNSEISTGEEEDLSATPVQVMGLGGEGFLTGVKKIAAGEFFGLALMDDKTVVSWGDNEFGELGNGSTDMSNVPFQVVGVGGTGVLSDVADIVGGYGHAVALLEDHRVVSWGDNEYGQIGDNSDLSLNDPTYSTAPVYAHGITTAKSITAGGDNTGVLLEDGSVRMWGFNDSGQTGDNTTGNTSTPTSPGTLVFRPFVVDGTFDEQQSTVTYSGDIVIAGQSVPVVSKPVTTDPIKNPIIWRDPASGGGLRFNGGDNKSGPVVVLDKQVSLTLRDIAASLSGESKEARFMKSLFGQGNSQTHSLKTGTNNFEVNASDVGDEGINEFKKAVFQAETQPEGERKIMDSEKKTDTVIGKITGNVRVVADDGKIYAAKEGMTLAKGDQIWTDKAAKAELSNKGNVVTVSEGSAVVVDTKPAAVVDETKTVTKPEEKPVQDLLQIAFGKVSVAVTDTGSESNFLVQTPNGMSGTRG